MSLLKMYQLFWTKSSKRFQFQSENQGPCKSLHVRSVHTNSLLYCSSHNPLHVPWWSQAEFHSRTFPLLASCLKHSSSNLRKYHLLNEVCPDHSISYCKFHPPASSIPSTYFHALVFFPLFHSSYHLLTNYMI